ncbi:hypothetical protein C0389_04395 [bacterium]|nr:hypothetical protein [bacterium]
MKIHPPYLYYEIYNLDTDAGGRTNFEQKIIVSEFKEEEEGFSVESAFRSVLDVMGIGEEQEKISLTSDFRMPEKDPQIYMQLDLSKYPAGKYLITVIIKDKLGGSVTETRSIIHWNN